MKAFTRRSSSDRYGIGILVFTLLILMLGAPVCAQTSNTTTWNFKDFYEQKKDIQLEGYQPSWVFYLPNFKGVNWGETRLALKIWFSEALSPESRISLLVNDQLVYFKLLKNIQLQSDYVAYLDIPIPESAIDEKKDRIKFEIRPTLTIGNTICDDLSSGNLWVIIKRESFISYSLKTDWNPQSVPDFFQGLLNQVTLVLPPQPWSDRIIQSYFTLHAFLNRLYRGYPLRIETIVASSQFSSPQSMNNNQIYLLEKSFRDFQVYGRKVFLTAEGVDLAISQYQQLMMNKSGKILNPVKEEAPQPIKKTLMDLGIDSIELKGFGDMQKNTRFFLSEVGGGSPVELSLRLYMNHTPLSPDFKGEALFKVYINSQLIYSKRLDQNSGGHLTPIDLQFPAQYIKPVNDLLIAFSYYPDANNCRQGMMPFEGFISGDSYLQPLVSIRPNDISHWQNIPGSFIKKVKIILPFELDGETLQAAANIYSSIRLTDSLPLPAEIISQERLEKELLSLAPLPTNWFINPYRINSFESWNNFIRIPSVIQNLLASPDFQNLDILQKILTTTNITASQYGLCVNQVLSSLVSNPIQVLPEESRSDFYIIISPGLIPGSLSSPVSVQSGQLIIQSPTQKGEPLKLPIDEPLCCLTLFQQNHTPVILLTTFDQKQVAFENFMKFFNPKETLFDLTGNVALIGKNGIVDLTTVESPSIGSQGYSLSSLSQYMIDQGPLLFIVLGVIMVLVLIFYLKKHRSGKEKK